MPQGLKDYQQQARKRMRLGIIAQSEVAREAELQRRAAERAAMGRGGAATQARLAEPPVATTPEAKQQMQKLAADRANQLEQLAKLRAQATPAEPVATGGQPQARPPSNAVRAVLRAAQGGGGQATDRRLRLTGLDRQGAQGIAQEASNNPGSIAKLLARRRRMLASSITEGVRQAGY